jgi:hypothetical protein
MFLEFNKKISNLNFVQMPSCTKQVWHLDSFNHAWILFSFSFVFSLHVHVYAYFILMNGGENQRFRVWLFHEHHRNSILQNLRSKFVIVSICSKLGFYVLCSINLYQYAFTFQPCGNFSCGFRVCSLMRCLMVVVLKESKIKSMLLFWQSQSNPSFRV